ncbi:NAD(P)/FAD-dependent oxidoreductase [Maribacter sp. MAR_2009_72]|uniref:NAD(P)/FAD-dependent oxidoreductase n=1 Tax=Maribacter sp. MAR_2009_72 TaxID=1250050 RepID=UPI00119B96E8|nr:NAD(P)/FAD-dependent oxidoreductase [Maribacter sp. MAR_2009_72]TVZ14332.1 flavin-dependent amine oxidoreductase [Maribacter sp. MAR_2009_72]
MDKQNYKIHIVGAGVSGLIAARVLEQNGFSPIILEATERVGGRVKTDVINGYQLDRGFQVLLTAYPAAKKYLNFNSLELQRILPGASIFKNKKQHIIGDPLRDLSLLFSTLFANIGTVTDKLKILRLNTTLKNTSLSEIFATKEQSTLAYLKNFGFSDGMIRDFFKPFFSGIFLEDQLETSSRMFQFVYKMFGEGDVAVPKGGMEEIPKQLVRQLQNTSIQYNTAVASINEKEILLANGTTLESDFTIVATEPSQFISNLKNQATEWHSCDTLYFETDTRKINKKLIGLLPETDSLINNIFYPTSLETKTSGTKELLSVTVVNNKGVTGKELVNRVQEELSKYCGITSCALLKHYHIPMSLPKLSELQYEVRPSETRLTETIYLAGDVQLNGSLNAAMLAGESAALGVLENLEGLFK